MRILEVIKPQEDEFETLVVQYDETFEDDNDDINEQKAYQEFCIQQQKDELYAQQFQEYYLEACAHRADTDDYMHHLDLPLGTDYTWLSASVAPEHHEYANWCKDQAYDDRTGKRLPCIWTKHKLSDGEKKFEADNDKILKDDSTTIEWKVSSTDLEDFIAHSLKLSKSTYCNETKQLLELFGLANEMPTKKLANYSRYDDEYADIDEVTKVIEISKQELFAILKDIREYTDHAGSNLLHEVLAFCGCLQRFHPGMTEARGSKHSPVYDVINQEGTVLFRMEWY
jgi:hypothetical protein